MQRILVMMAAVVSLSVVADEVVITDSVLKEVLGKKLSKPYGKFAPPMKLTKAEVEKVTDLKLFRTQITDAGLKEVAKLQNLKYLWLPDQITDAGLKEVAKLQNLTELNLWDTDISDAGLKEVAKLQNLTELDLNDTQITDVGL
ncbi:MAG: leucine-rich repeat domain-containing protein, partial [Limisphaerales bacterium]